MKTVELAELLLTKLYEQAEATGHGNFYSLIEIAHEFGETDVAKIINVAKYLDDQEWIRKNIQYNGGVDAILIGAGAIFVEKGGATGIIPKYQRNPAAFVVNINNSVVGSVNAGEIKELIATVKK